MKKLSQAPTRPWTVEFHPQTSTSMSTFQVAKYPLLSASQVLHILALLEQPTTNFSILSLARPRPPGLFPLSVDVKGKSRSVFPTPRVCRLDCLKTLQKKPSGQAQCQIRSTKPVLPSFRSTPVVPNGQTSMASHPLWPKHLKVKNKCWPSFDLPGSKPWDSDPGILLPFGHSKR